MLGITPWKFYGYTMYITSFVPIDAVAWITNVCVIDVSKMLFDDGVNVDAVACTFWVLDVVTYQPLAAKIEQFLFIFTVHVLITFICTPTFMPTVLGFLTFANMNLIVFGQVQKF